MPAIFDSVEEMPVTHPYWIEYVSNSPRAYFGPREIVAENIARDAVWDYRKSKFVPIDNLIWMGQ